MLFTSLFTPQQKQNTCFAELQLVLGVKTREVRILIIFQDKPMFSRIEFSGFRRELSVDVAEERMSFFEKLRKKSSHFF